jgi:hypothetical protein
VFSLPTYSVSESAGTVTVTVLRQLGVSGTVNVNYATGDSTAVAGSDYTAASGTLTFLAGETSKSFTVSITKDSQTEPDENINLTLSNVTGSATLGGQSNATIKILGQ